MKIVGKDVRSNGSGIPGGGGLPPHPAGVEEGFATLDGDRIADVAFQGSGCAISKASASLMTEAVKGKTLAEARELFDRFHLMVTSSPDTAAPDLGKLSVFSGVREYPTRVKCASLAWHTLRAAMADEQGTVSTE